MQHAKNPYIKENIELPKIHFTETLSLRNKELEIFVSKKEFAKKDVQRLRNVLKGKAGERTVDGIGYTKVNELRKEGDIWTENEW